MEKIELFEARQKMKDSIVQVKYIVDGLAYHYSNIKSLYSQFQVSPSVHLVDKEDTFRAIKHEVVAYLNRLGQFHSFVKSHRVNDILSEPLQYIEFICKIIVLRQKQTAHRATDMPHWTDAPYDIETLDKRFSYGTITINNTIIFDLYHTEHDKSIRFEPLEDHAKVMSEIESFFEKMKEKVYEEDTDITNGEICKWLINELYVVWFFAERDNRLDVLIANSAYHEEEVNEAVAHLCAIDWIKMYNAPLQAYSFNPRILSEIESRKIINPELLEIVRKNKERILKAINHSEEHSADNLSCAILSTNEEEKDSLSIVREDLGVGIDFMAFYKSALRNLGYLTSEFKLTELGKRKVLELEKDKQT